ncbi:uncharacterized protein LY89DRAFT_726581 [Mollisia scopiformis]|uniref:Uncharacterized protein n=1 Tax=Mollisia scopiformis TaxID=149040 RepID=A0A132B1Y7_MOLSC|nr:uncharacterized protein LY89DRAFT_726581 [Mollisia scopiformis]KUJ06396.1 hypothetical protein LY89DRAFT_726581 [Mollisia scopiformis]
MDSPFYGVEMDEDNLDALADLEPVANGWDRALRRNENRPLDDLPPTENRPLRAFSNGPPPSQVKKENEQLAARDNNAVNYSKALLEHGDTLVIIRYPNEAKVYDATGFEIRDRHRVHSEKLLATGSSKFKHMLEDEWYQHRAKRRNKLIGNMPIGIKYVLDLTPPEEGDDALELTSELSCPTGILLWRNAAARCNISDNLVGGKDETTVRPDPVQTQPQDLSGHGATSRAQAVAFVLNSAASNTSPSEKSAAEPDEAPILDYDPIRHRTGIERLLQVIEGKDPRIDSAPKVWTLAVLAKHFECTSVVQMDFIFTWVWADPNCRIIETLPEACIRIGMMLQSPRLVRTAFSVLVSEEALRIGTEQTWKDDREIQQRVLNYRPHMTRIGRVRESIDEDTLNTIQHAGQQFAGRVDAVVVKLYDPEMKWLHDLPEFAKLKKLLDHNIKIAGADYTAKQQSIINLENELLHYVRGRLLWCFIAQLENHQLKRATEHRKLEAYKHSSGMSFGTVYDSLRDKERMMTRYFWEIIRNLDWGLHCTTNQIHDWLPDKHPFADMQQRIAEENGIRKVTTYTLVRYAKIVNDQILDVIKVENYNDGNFPPECYVPIQLSIDSVSEKFDDWSLHPDEPENDGLVYRGSGHQPMYPATPMSTAVEPPGFQKQPSTVEQSRPTPTPNVWETLNAACLYTPQVPADERITESSVFFCLPTFLKNVNDHLVKICASMLDNDENEWSITCDTLLCLTDDEYKFLPLFAGGTDDGTGGVFEDAIPAAEKGPSGPGPAFHTGSTMGSRASSLADWDALSYDGTEMAGVDSSLGVEDGYSEDHIDRRDVKSEEDFPQTLSTSLPIRGKEDKGKGKQVEDVEDFMDDDFFDGPGDDDDFDHIDADEGNATE